MPSEEAHANALNDLDALRLSLAKSINDAEGILASKEAELASLKEECAKLETSDPAAEHELDATTYVLCYTLDLAGERADIGRCIGQAETIVHQGTRLRACFKQGRTCSENFSPCVTLFHFY